MGIFSAGHWVTGSVMIDGKPYMFTPQGVLVEDGVQLRRTITKRGVTERPHLFSLNAVQFVFSALVADSSTLFTVSPGQMLVLGLQNQLGNGHRLVIFVQGNHHEMGVVDPHPIAVRVFYIGIYADFHGSVAYPGELALDHDHIVLIRTGQKCQIIHRCGGHITHAVPLGYNAGHLVDPLH